MLIAAFLKTRSLQLYGSMRTGKTGQQFAVRDWIKAVNGGEPTKTWDMKEMNYPQRSDNSMYHSTAITYTSSHPSEIMKVALWLFLSVPKPFVLLMVLQTLLLRLEIHIFVHFRNSDSVFSRSSFYSTPISAEGRPPRHVPEDIQRALS